MPNRFALTLVMAFAAGIGPAAQTEIGRLLPLIGAKVEQYYAGARTIICVERVSRQPLGMDLLPDGFARDLEYELTVTWNPPEPGEAAGDAHFERRLLTVNGQPPNAKDEDACVDPRPASPEPRTVFLSRHRADYRFSIVGEGRLHGQHATVVEYLDAVSQPPSIEWDTRCVSIEVPAKTRGRAWVDEAGNVLRLDESLMGMFDVTIPDKFQSEWQVPFATLERADWSIEFRPQAFPDSDETLWVPASSTSLTIFRAQGVSRIRTTEVFTNYRRFVTGGRMVN